MGWEVDTPDHSCCPWWSWASSVWLDFLVHNLWSWNLDWTRESCPWSERKAPSSSHWWTARTCARNYCLIHLLYGLFTNMSLNVNSPCLSLSISLSLLWPTIKSKFTTHFQYKYCICLKTMMMVAWWGASPNCSSPTLSTKVSKSPMPLIKTHCKIHKFNRCRTVPTQKFLNKSFGSKLL